MDIDARLGKMRRKLEANADHFPTEQMHIAYVESRVEEDAHKHIAARSRPEARNPFTTAEEVFAVLFKAYGDTNRKHTAMNKFRDLRMTTTKTIHTTRLFTFKPQSTELFAEFALTHFCHILPIHPLSRVLPCA